MRLVVSALLAAANAALVVFGAWGLHGGFSPGSRSYAYVSAASLAAIYALLARGRSRPRALLVLPSTLSWFGLGIVGLMGTFLGPMDGVQNHFCAPFFVFAVLMFFVMGATLEAFVALRRAT